MTKKNVTGQVLTYNSKNFHWLNNKNLDLEMAMTGLGKPIRKDPIKKSRKQLKIKAQKPHVNKKPVARNRIFVHTPFSLYLKFDWKISRQKISRYFAPLPVSAWPKPWLQFEFKNYKNVWIDLKNTDGRILETQRNQIILTDLKHLLLDYNKYLEKKTWKQNDKNKKHLIKLTSSCDMWNLVIKKYR